ADEQLKQLRDITKEGLSVNFSQEEAELMTHSHERINVFDFGGPLSFGAAADVGHQIREKSDQISQVMILDFGQVPFIDVSAARAVETIANDGKISKKQVYISGMNEKVRDVLEALIEDVIPGNHYFNSRRDAIAAAVEYVESTDENI
ncbi:MAG: sodium-independent anion transporter, partial [Gammaproteobacteria bacterium]|nr:sodium-independent anion transporter [Gammaproteobacteria bacterium]